MAATGKTPILLYGSTTATNAPVAGNLTNSSDGCEIAINVADKNLFFKDSTNAVNTVPIRQSSGSSDGWLSSANWTTFNSKQAAYTNLTSIGSLANATGWLYNNGSGTFSYSTPTKSDVGLSNVENTALSTWAGSTNITTLGTIGTGAWNATTIGTTKGGTGLTSFTANGVVYASSTSALATGSGLQFDGANLGVGIAPSTSYRVILSSAPATSADSFQLKWARSTGANTGVGDYVQAGVNTTGAWFGRRYLATIGWTAAVTGSNGLVLNTGDVGAETEQVRLATTGNMTLNTGNLVIGTSGKGIDFSVTGDSSGTTTSELLADYEEGTFTPVVNGSTTTGTGTYSIQLGRYTKIGNVVNFYINLAWSAHTGTGNFNPISGLPYTAANVTNNYSALAVYTSALGMTAGNTIQAVTVPNTSTVVLRQVPTGGGFSVVIPLDAAVDNLIITGSYQTT